MLVIMAEAVGTYLNLIDQIFIFLSVKFYFCSFKTWAKLEDIHEIFVVLINILDTID